MKKVVYKVLASKRKQGQFDGYEVYSDGTINTPAPLGVQTDLDKDFQRSSSDFENSIIERKRYEIEKNHYIGLLPAGYNNCPLTCPEGDEEAFYTLCLLLDDVPPFKGYKIEYFGEGNPWIPNPEYDPDPSLIIN